VVIDTRPPRCRRSITTASAGIPARPARQSPCQVTGGGNRTARKTA